MIDVIIPVYNTPINDIKRCLESIFKQTYQNYKIYIIDDGSKEEIKEYLDKINNKNIIIHHITNSGVSNARNYGMKVSNGEYITFIDSDDTIEPTFFNEAIKILEDNNLDIVIGGYNEINNNEITKTRTANENVIYNKKNIKLFQEKLISSKNNKYNTKIGNSPVGRIYGRLFKRESLNNYMFNPKIKMSEDTLYMIELSYIINKLGVVTNIWYNYYNNTYSISHNVTKEKIIPFINEIILKIENETDEDLKKAYKYRLVKTLNNNINILNEEYIKQLLDRYIKDIEFNYQ